MKQRRVKNNFLEHLRKMPNISSACDALNLSRNTVYRWRKEDAGFATSWDVALSEGEDHINDFVENKLILKVKEGNWGAIKYHLDKRHPKYIDKKPDQVLMDFIKKQKNKEDQALMDTAYENVRGKKIQYTKDGKAVEIDEATVRELFKSLFIDVEDYSVLMEITKEEAQVVFSELWKENQEEVNSTSEEQVMTEYLKLKEEKEE